MAFYGHPPRDEVAGIIPILDGQQWVVYGEINLESGSAELQMEGPGLSLVLEI